MAFVLLIFPWLSFTLWCLLAVAKGSSGIWLLFISDCVEEHYADPALTWCVLFLVIVHSHSRDFYKIGLAFSKKKFCAAIECWMKCFWSNLWLECSLEFCSHWPATLRALRQYRRTDFGEVGLTKFNLFLGTSLTHLFYR